MMIAHDHNESSAPQASSSSGEGALTGFTRTRTTSSYSEIINSQDTDSPYVSLDANLQPRLNRTETTSREWYFSPSCIGGGRPLSQYGRLPRLQTIVEGGRVVGGDQSGAESLPQTSSRVDSTFQSTTSLVQQNGESVSEVVTESTTETVEGDDSDAGFYAVSPILGECFPKCTKRYPEMRCSKGVLCICTHISTM